LFYSEDLIAFYSENLIAGYAAHRYADSEITSETPTESRCLPGHRYLFSLLHRERTPMVRWTLKCRNCGYTFTYSVGGDTLVEYLFPMNPKLPPQGVKCECPNCKAKFTYEQSELRYERKRAGS
jgi:rubredoxin